MKIIDLFAGIGGFAYAFDQVFYEEKNEHIFVENDPFCQAVLRKHWPKAEIHGDIREFVADARSQRQEERQKQTVGGEQRSQKLKTPQKGESKYTHTGTIEKQYLNFLTGGFPCQPFSQAGRRKGTADDRYLWPPMFEAITLFRPRWVIAENVAGLASWNEGLVLETVCADLENEGYEVQPLIIPACAVGAPHRRDRIWIVANRKSGRKRSGEQERSRSGQPKEEIGNGNRNAPDTKRKRLERTAGYQKLPTAKHTRFSGWSRDWQEVALATCHDGVDDGLSRRMDGVTISGARHRRERLKACGNAIVPQVAIEIMKAIHDNK